MCITAVIAAIGAGFQIFSGVQQNNALNQAGSRAVANAQATNALGILKADAAYLGAIAQSNTDEAANNAEKERLESLQKRLNAVAIIASIIVTLVAVVIAIKKSRQ